MYVKSWTNDVGIGTQTFCSRRWINWCWKGCDWSYYKFYGWEWWIWDI